MRIEGQLFNSIGLLEQFFAFCSAYFRSLGWLLFALPTRCGSGVSLKLLLGFLNIELPRSNFDWPKLTKLTCNFDRHHGDTYAEGQGQL